MFIFLLAIKDQFRCQPEENFIAVTKINTLQSFILSLVIMRKELQLSSEQFLMYLMK